MHVPDAWHVGLQGTFAVGGHLQLCKPTALASMSCSCFSEVHAWISLP